MKKLLFGALALGLVVASCEKEDIALANETQETVAVADENTRRMPDVQIEKIDIVSSGEIWWNLKLLSQALMPDPTPPEMQEYFELNVDRLLPILGPERVDNVISGTWTIDDNGSLEVGTTYQLKFSEGGTAVNLFEAFTVE